MEGKLVEAGMSGTETCPLLRILSVQKHSYMCP